MARETCLRTNNRFFLPRLMRCDAHLQVSEHKTGSSAQHNLSSLKAENAARLSIISKLACVCAAAVAVRGPSRPVCQSSPFRKGDLEKPILRELGARLRTRVAGGGLIVVNPNHASPPQATGNLAIICIHKPHDSHDVQYLNQLARQ